jgi:uncharacterized repeat protein (TIGR03803 family)
MRNQTRIGLYLVLACTVLASASLVRAQTYEFSKLYSFQNNGADPEGPVALIIGSDGNLYGASVGGGTHGWGTVFELTPAGRLTVLYNFSFTNLGPNSLARDNRQGNLYGSTLGYNGTVFELVKGSGGNYTLSTLYSNTSGKSQPQSVTLDSTGNLWGTDDASHGCLCVFEIPAGGEWTDRYATGGQPVEPQGNVLVTPAGDVFASIDNFGIDGNGWVPQVNGPNIYFPPPGYGPNSLALDAAGSIYGLAYGGLTGGPNNGLVFKADTTPWHVSTIYTFKGADDGAQPSGPFAVDSAGNVFGTASGGKSGHGVVFKVTPEGVESVLHTFTDDSNPLGLVMDGSGNLYGVRQGGGNPDFGSVWKLTLEQ